MPIPKKELASKPYYCAHYRSRHVRNMPLPTGNVTFLFTDIEGSTRLWEADREGMEHAIDRHDLILRGVMEHHGGRIFKTVGDAIHAAFDSALKATLAAAAVQRAVSAENWPSGLVIKVRCGLNTGLAQLRDRDYFGPALNRLARLLALASGGETLLTASTYEIVRDVLPEGLEIEESGERALKDIERPERVYRVVDRRNDYEALPPIPKSSIVSESELEPSESRTLYEGQQVELTEDRYP